MRTAAAPGAGFDFDVEIDVQPIVASWSTPNAASNPEVALPLQLHGAHSRALLFGVGAVLGANLGDHVVERDVATQRHEQQHLHAAARRRESVRQSGRASPG